jgi:hypothetical protein
MATVGKHSAAPASRGASDRPRDTAERDAATAGAGHPGRGRRIASYAVAAVLTALAWAVLVYFAIQLGPDVKDGEPRAWALIVVATIGAMACLFLSLVLAGRVLDTLRPAAPAGPPPPPGGRRAKR